MLPNNSQQFHSFTVHYPTLKLLLRYIPLIFIKNEFAFKNTDSKQQPWHTKCVRLSLYLTLACLPSNVSQYIHLYVGIYRVVLAESFIHTKTGQFSEAFCSSGLQVNYIFGNPSVNSNLQLEWLLLFITVSAPSEQHEIRNIPQGNLSTPCRGCSVWPVLVLKNICMGLHCQISFLNRELCNFKGKSTDIFINIEEYQSK